VASFTFWAVIPALEVTGLGLVNEESKMLFERHKKKNTT